MLGGLDGVSEGKIIVDGNEYDLDCEFCHNDADATESLCAIDCLIADIDEDEEEIMKNIEIWKINRIRN